MPLLQISSDIDFGHVTTKKAPEAWYFMMKYIDNDANQVIVKWLDAEQTRFAVARMLCFEIGMAWATYSKQGDESGVSEESGQRAWNILRTYFR